jgi:membrane protein YdbS with pleckstrin-like domain
MYERGRNLLLRILKVPPEPHPPVGDPASLRVFRAGRNFFRLQLARWGLAQAAALAGIIFWAVVLIQVEDAARVQRQARRAQAAAAPAPVPPDAAASAATPATSSATVPAKPPSREERLKKSLNEALKEAKKRGRVTGWQGFKLFLVEVALLLPDWAFPIIWLLKISGFALYLLQIPITYAVRRLDYEMHWYVVTDRSLRLRNGVWNVQELTMSFANLQQVVVSQGPLQRLLGLADVRVQSAGGGGGEHAQASPLHSLHTGYFHSVDNATEIRDLILERLRRFRESGLGDPDEARRHPPADGAATALVHEAGVLAAARELRDEARALRLALG